MPLALPFILFSVTICYHHHFWNVVTTFAYFCYMSGSIDSFTRSAHVKLERSVITNWLLKSLGEPRMKVVRSATVGRSVPCQLKKYCNSANSPTFQQNIFTEPRTWLLRVLKKSLLSPFNSHRKRWSRKSKCWSNDRMGEVQDLLETSKCEDEFERNLEFEKLQLPQCHQVDLQRRATVATAAVVHVEETKEAALVNGCLRKPQKQWEEQRTENRCVVERFARVLRLNYPHVASCSHW